MRKTTEVLRLKFEARLSHEKIAAATGLSKGAVTNYVRRAVQKALTWPLPPELDEGRLEALLFRQPAPRQRYAQPDYALMHQELKRKGVTLQLLWEEYLAAHGGEAYRYSQFCVHYHEYRSTLARSMRQVHRAGEKVFIDYSGDTVAIIDPNSGAAVRWLREQAHKATHESDKAKLRWLDAYLAGLDIEEVNRTVIDRIIAAKRAEGCVNATVNRTLALLRAIPRRCAGEWEWMDRAPAIRLLKEPTRRIRFLTRSEAAKLLRELPDHLRDAAIFALATGYGPGT